MSDERISQEVLDAILSGTTSVTRRLEIYESDGETKWDPGEAKMIDGSISVDYSRDERRTIDVTLDNKDGSLRHDPRDGFWYDKILKAYRGIQYRNTRQSPRILALDLLNESTAKPRTILRRLGYTDITYKNSITELSDLQGYDLIFCYNHNTALSSARSMLLKTAWYSGMNIMTVGNNNGTGELPFVRAAYVKDDAAQWAVNPPELDTPLVDGWSGANTGDTSTGKVPYAVSADAIPVGVWTWQSHLTYPAIIAQNSIGARWFNYTPLIPSAGLPPQLLRLWANALRWLYTWGDTRSWEIQLGEFMIDQIDSDSFPKHIHVTGRDYTKKLVNVKFRRATTYSKGLKLDSVISGIAINSGVKKFLGGSPGVTLDADLSFEREDERWGAIKDICTANSVEVFFNRYGYLVTRPFRDPSTSPTTLTLQTGPIVGNLVRYSKSSNDSQLANVVVVTAETPDSDTTGKYYQGVATNNEPNSPTRVGRLGERNYFYTTTLAKSDAQCLQIAQDFLKVKSLEEFNVNYSSLVFPWLEAGDIIEFDDPGNDLQYPDRFLHTSFNIPLGLGPMDGTMNRITIIGSTIIKPGQDTPQTAGDGSGQ
jgi:hypothetical protein